MSRRTMSMLGLILATLATAHPANAGLRSELEGAVASTVEFNSEMYSEWATSLVEHELDPKNCTIDLPRFAPTNQRDHAILHVQATLNAAFTSTCFHRDMTDHVLTITFEHYKCVGSTCGWHETTTPTICEAIPEGFGFSQQACAAHYAIPLDDPVLGKVHHAKYCVEEPLFLPSGKKYCLYSEPVPVTRSEVESLAALIPA